MTNGNHDHDQPDQKTCIACGRSFPATPEYFAKNYKNKKGEVILRPRCISCHREYRAEESEYSEGSYRDSSYNSKGEKKEIKFKLPPGCNYGRKRQIKRCREGEGLQILTAGTYGRPILRTDGIDLGPGEICVILR